MVLFVEVIFGGTVLKAWDSCGGCQKGRNSCALEHSKRKKSHFYIFCALILISCCCYPHRYWWGWQCPRVQWWCTIHWGHAPTGGWWRRRFSHGGGGLNCLPLDTSSAGWGSSRGGRDDSDDHEGWKTPQELLPLFWDVSNPALHCCTVTEPPYQNKSLFQDCVFFVWGVGGMSPLHSGSVLVPCGPLSFCSGMMVPPGDRSLQLHPPFALG